MIVSVLSGSNLSYQQRSSTDRIFSFFFLCVMGAHQGAFMPRHSGSSSHSTLIPAHQPVIQAPLYYYLYFPLHRPWTRTHREVDLRTDIWLSGCASGRGEAGAETGVAASLCLFPFSPVPTYRISSGRRSTEFMAEKYIKRSDVAEDERATRRRSSTCVRTPSC